MKNSVFCAIIVIVGKKRNMKKGSLLKLSKIFVWIYMILTFIGVFLPDEFVIGIVKLDYRLDPFQMLMRWFNFVAFLTLPVAAYFNKPTFKKISVYFSIPVVIILMFMFKDILPGYMSENGTGIVDIRFLPDFVVKFLHNGVFRGIFFFATCLSQIAATVCIALQDLNDLKFKKEDVKNFFIILPLLIISIVPIYAIEGILDHQSNIEFKFFSLSHIAWMILIVLQILVLYRIFKDKSKDDKFILILILSLSLLVQYNQLFCSMGELTCKRMPLQLCNLASYLIIIALLKNNRTIFIFNLLVNVIGAIIAVIILDADNTCILSKGNIHYIVEHNNVVVIPFLMLLLGVFEPVKKHEFKVFFKWFTIYFIIIFILGTTFNAIYTATDNNYFKCNYLFMFDAEKARKLISFSKYLFDVKITIGPVTLYPLIQAVIYLVFTGLGYLSFLFFRKAIKEKEVQTVSEK